ncbi:MAG: HEAT repeat domain-containing protein [Armatimonadetes bacterium]|nr:HEAT repeat domain-containing protein [Armatimonadota bacterium]
MSPEMAVRLANRVTRTKALIEVCRKGLKDYLPLALGALDKLTWGEVEEVAPFLPLLGNDAVPALCRLLNSTRKQTAAAVTEALAVIGDARACGPLVAMMEQQAGSANALRARDSLIAFAEAATPSLLQALESPNWEVRYHVVQVLAVAGDVRAIEALADISLDDRSARVRDAAVEAMMLIPAVGKDEAYATRDGFYNPTII